MNVYIFFTATLICWIYGHDRDYDFEYSDEGFTQGYYEYCTRCGITLKQKEY
jgi:hypothetical protein